MSPYTGRQITCLIIDDHEIIGEGIRARLNAFTNIEVSGLATSGEAGLEMILRDCPTVALVDFQMPGITGIEVIERALARNVTTRFVLFTAMSGRALVDRAFEVGAHGFISKTSPTYTIEQAIYAVAAGGTYVDPTLASVVLQPSESPLSSREEEVLALMGEGLANKVIATRLQVSGDTVKSHVAKVMEKLEATNRTEAVIKAFRSSLLT